GSGIEELRQAEVEQLHVGEIEPPARRILLPGSFLGDDRIRRLDVAMEDSTLVRRAEPARKSQRQLEEVRAPYRPRERAEGRPADELRHEVRPPLHLPDPMHGD